MTWITRVFGPVALVAVAASAGAAQPPGGDGPAKRKDFPGPPGGLKGPGAPGGEVPGVPPGGWPGAPKADPQVEAWVKMLVEKMNDPHDAIRDSARAALVAVGPPAVPMLQQLSAGSDAKAYTAQRLLQQIRQGGGFGGAAGMMPGAGGAPGQPLTGGPGPLPGGTPPLGAPDAPPPPGRVDGNPLARVIGALNLNEKQKTQAERVLTAYQQKVRDAADQLRNRAIDRNQARDAAEKAAADATAEFRRLLTPAQVERLDTLVPGGRPLFPIPFAPPPVDPPGGRGGGAPTPPGM